MRVCLISGISHRFPWLSQSQGQVAHVLLTRSPLIRPASWPSPFDLHVLSTPPAFVLSQNQTLRKCLHGTGTTKADRQPTHETVPKDQSDSAVFEPPTHGGGCHDSHLNQDPPHHCDGPSWHRLLGTLLSSQGTDAHPFRSLDLLGGNCSNLAEPVFRVKLACQAGCRGEHGSWVQTLQSTGDRVAGRSVRGCLPGGPATELILGVRSSLPGDIEKITQRPARRANPLHVTPVTAVPAGDPAGFLGP
jgi:hypothetical protein